MPVRVPYLSESTIELDAQRLIDEFCMARGVQLKAPVPIEDIVEKHLKLTLEFDDMHERLGFPRLFDTGNGPDILGAVFFDEGFIAIDESLNPDENPSKEGRYRFTLGHETGHWRLHRHLFPSAVGQNDLFGAAGGPSFICRAGAKTSEEWQADYYASCILMPRRLLMHAWNTMLEDTRPRIVDARADHGGAYVDLGRWSLHLAGEVVELESVDEAMERFAKPFAELFKVSAQAMRIRLERMGLLVRGTPSGRLFATGR
jgi:Zn-dependent peptidase ImmA (M78 family)